jgi:hypothetical protein
MLRDPLLSCDWGAKGRTASPYPHRPGVGELHLGLATAPPPLEAAAPDCRGEAICTTPLPCEESREPCTRHGNTAEPGVGQSRLQWRTGISRYAAVLLR